MTDQDGPISTVTIVYQINGGGFVNQASMSLTVGDTYEGTIPGQVLGTDVDYYVEAEDADSNIGRNPSDAPLSFYSYTVQNEVITSIADIHANTAAFAGSLVVIQGQVFCPGNYQQDGSSVVGVTLPDNRGRRIIIIGGGTTGYQVEGVSPSGVRVVRDGSTAIIMIGGERYEIPDTLLDGR